MRAASAPADMPARTTSSTPSSSPCGDASATALSRCASSCGAVPAADERRRAQVQWQSGPSLQHHMNPRDGPLTDTILMVEVPSFLAENASTSLTFGKAQRSGRAAVALGIDSARPAALSEPLSTIVTKAHGPVRLRRRHIPTRACAGPRERSGITKIPEEGLVCNYRTTGGGGGTAQYRDG